MKPRPPRDGNDSTSAHRDPPDDASWVLFGIGSELYALPVPSVREILPIPWLSRPPWLPNVMEGFLNLGGSVVPVLRLTRLFDLPEFVPDLYTPLVVVGVGEDAFALLVEHVLQVRRIPVSAVAEVEEKRCLNGCVTGQLRLDDAVVQLLRPEKLLLEEETRRIAAFREMEKERLRRSEGDGG